MHNSLLRLPLAVFLLAAVACSGKTASDDSCKTNSDCEAGWICDVGECAQLCSLQRDCPSGQVCVDDHCQVPQSGTLPIIDAMFGNDAADPTRITDGIVVTGNLLADASFELQSASDNLVLTVRDTSETRVELIFPADIRSGNYTLVATNAAGSAQAPVTLTLPDLTGDMLVGRMNDAATTDVVHLDRLATEVQTLVGASCTGGQVAAGVNSDGSLACQQDQVLSSTDVQSMLAQGLTAGTVPTAGASGLTDGSIHDGGAGKIGIGLTQPAGLLDVGAGFQYVLNQNVGGTPTPACDCDVDQAVYDCGSAEFSSSHFQGTTCYDTGAGGNDEYVTTDEPFLTVTDAGPVGINIGNPQATLHVNGDIRYNGGILGPGGHRRLDINVFSAGNGAAASASNHSVYVNGDLVSTSARGVHLTVLSGSDGSVVYSQDYDTHADSAGQGAALASAIATYNTAGNILILNTSDQPAYVAAALSTALLDVMKSTRIAIEGVAYRGAFAIAYQNGKGKLGEDVSNSYGGATQFGNDVHANASLQIVTYLGW